MLWVTCGPVLRGVVGNPLGRDRGVLRIKSNWRVSLLVTIDLSLLRLLAGDEMRVLLNDSRWTSNSSSSALSIVKRVPLDGLKDRIRLHRYV